MKVSIIILLVYLCKIGHLIESNKSKVCVKNNIFVGFVVDNKTNFGSYVFNYYESVIINVNYFIRTDNDVNYIKKNNILFIMNFVLKIILKFVLSLVKKLI